MKVSIVPAQITTVEDKIAGNLSLHQLALLISPFLFGFIAYLVFPPLLQFVPYKFALAIVLFIVCALLAIRVKGQLLVFWLLMRSRYNARPRYYVYRKTSTYLRRKTTEVYAEEQQESTPATQTTGDQPEQQPLSTADIVKVQEIIENPKAKLRFQKGKDGRLNVIIQEIK